MTQQQTNTQPDKQPKVLRAFAHIVSFICHPVFFPVVMAFVAYLLDPATLLAFPAGE